MISRTVKLPGHMIDRLNNLISHFPKSSTRAYVEEFGFPKQYSMCYTTALKCDYLVCQKVQEFISSVQDEVSKFYETSTIPDGHFVVGRIVLSVKDPIGPLVDKVLQLQHGFIEDMSIGTVTSVSA